MDRSPFIRRLLRYYASTRFRHWILIGDSSGPEHAERNQHVVREFQGTLNLLYQAYPGLRTGAGGCLEELSRLVSTPYCAFVGDDDVLCTSGLERCLAFLEAHPEYGAAHGQGFWFQTESHDAHGPLGTMGSYPQAVVEAPTGAQRFVEYFAGKRGVVFYAVHRTPIWQAMFQGLAAMTNKRGNGFQDELIATGVSVIQGKVKSLDVLYLMRHVHAAAARHPHFYDWVTDPDWFPSFQLFQERLIEELIQQDGASREMAATAIRQGFWPYVAHLVKTTGPLDRPRSVQPAPSRLRTWAKRIPGLRRTWRALRAQSQRWGDPCSLPALLHPSSPYYGDFLPIYRAITKAPVVAC